MLVDSAYVLAGLVLLFFGGEALVRGSVAIAERMGFEGELSAVLDKLGR